MERVAACTATSSSLGPMKADRTHRLSKLEPWLQVHWQQLGLLVQVYWNLLVPSIKVS